MKFSILLGAGLGAGVIPLAAAGIAHAQDAAPETVAISSSYISLTGGSISGADYEYRVEDIFPVRAEMGDGYIIEAAYGMKLGDGWRAEAAVSWRDHNNASSNWQFGINQIGPGVSAYTIDAIGYRDFPINARANFYIGAGLGIASVTFDDGVITDSTGTGLQLQGIAGVEAQLGMRLKVFAEARLRSVRPEIQAGTAGAAGEVRDDFDVTSTSVQAGIKFLL